MGNKFSNDIAVLSQIDPIPMEALIMFSTEYKETHGKNLIILKGVSGITSTISSSALIFIIFRSQKGISTTQHRLLIGLCIFDIFSSLSVSTFNAVIPSENDFAEWNARGNEATCDTQGFLMNLGLIGGLFYNASINLYYLAVVKYQKRDSFIRSKIEPYLHGIPIVVALSYSVGRLIRKQYNPDAGGSCGVLVNYFPHCWGYDIGETRPGFKIPCGRGIEGSMIAFYSQMVLMFIPVLAIIIPLGMIYASIRRQEITLAGYGVNVGGGASALSDEHQQQQEHELPKRNLWRRIFISTSLTRRSNRNSRSESRAVMYRAFAYTVAWVLTYGINLALIVTQLVGYPPLPLLYLTSILLPLQGFFNLLIYMYPKAIIAAKKKATQDTDGERLSWCQTISKVFWSRDNSTSIRNHGPNQSNRPLRTRKKDENRFTRRAGSIHEDEEEKCEIQPATVNNTPWRQQIHFTYASNLIENKEGMDDHIAPVDTRGNQMASSIPSGSTDKDFLTANPAMTDSNLNATEKDDELALAEHDKDSISSLSENSQG